MKVSLIVISKTIQPYLRDGLQEYLQRLKHYVSFEYIEIPDLKNVKNLSHDEQKKKEGELLLRKIEQNSNIILLDEKGKHFDSLQFANFIQEKMNVGTRNLVFLIGGPYGFSEEMYKAAHSQISLSKMTFSHQMVRLIFMEQLYRGFTILKGEPYHHQ